VLEGEGQLKKLKEIECELNIVPTTLENWLKTKLENESIEIDVLNKFWKRQQWKLQLDKQ